MTGRTFCYDAENRPVSILKNGVITEFKYDGDSKRVLKTINDGMNVYKTYYIASLYEEEIKI